MNPNIVSISLSKNINKFFVINTLIVISALISVILITGYERKELIITISLCGIGILTTNLFITKVIRQKVTKLIKNSFEKVESQLYFDELTSVYNRKTGMNRLLEEISRSKRTRKPLSIAILDIDNFKKINDKYGHLVGDRVLNHVATQIKNSLRGCDVVARYGGEEFLIILAETDEIHAIPALERVRNQIAKKAIKVGNERLYVTVSIGVTEIEPDEDPIASIEKADLALYQAKRNGKNKVELFLKYTKNRN
ncbi:MAG: GGDEF domain-containing protein [Thermodesulfovibrio sp.]|nr:GGDEF domain-containing protein [Thermodesulfovibrio sp.]